MNKPVDIVNHSTGALPADLMESIHHVMHLFRSLQYRDMPAASGDLTHMEGKVLGYYARHPGSTQSDLVAHSGRDKGQLARLIAQLKDRGLLVARSDAADRRSVRLELSPAGRAVHQSLGSRVAELAERSVTGLDASERQALLKLIRTVETNLESALAADRAR